MAGTTDWSGFDTEAHRAAQANCHHLIHCAVDADTRAAVSRHLDQARSVGDGPGILLAIAQLTGPCCLPPGAPTLPGTATPPTSPRPGPSRPQEGNP